MALIVAKHFVLTLNKIKDLKNIYLRITRKFYDKNRAAEFP